MATTDETKHRYPAQVTRVGVAGYKGKVDVYEDETAGVKARAAVEDKARRAGKSK